MFFHRRGGLIFCLFHTWCRLTYDLGNGRGGGVLKTHAAKMSCNDDEFVKLYLNRVRCIIYLLNCFVYFKDTRDVPQFQIIFLDRIFLFYLHLNLFMPKNSGCINRLILSLNTLNISFKSMKNTIKCFLLKLKDIFSIETIYIHLDKYHITWKCNVGIT